MIKRDYLVRAVSIGMAVSTAVLLNGYTEVDLNGLMVLAGFFTTQTTPGARLRQGIIISLIMMLAVIFGSVLISLTSLPVIYGIVSLLFIVSGLIVFYHRLLTPIKIVQIMLFVFILMVVVFAVNGSEVSVADKLISVGLGSIIGIFFNQFVFPVKVEKSFFDGMLPLLGALQNFSASLVSRLQGATDCLTEKKLAVERSLLFQEGAYPSWVYEVGFNPGLRSGWRYFLVNLERMVDSYFALDFLVKRELDLSTLMEPIVVVMKRNEELLKILICYVETRKIQQPNADFISDLSELEDALKQVIPGSVELLDLLPSYVAVASVVRHLRDIRGLLLQLIKALPA